jgi:hypothetical protein
MQAGWWTVCCHSETLSYKTVSHTSTRRYQPLISGMRRTAITVGYFLTQRSTSYFNSSLSNHHIRYEWSIIIVGYLHIGWSLILYFLVPLSSHHVMHEWTAIIVEQFHTGRHLILQPITIQPSYQFGIYQSWKLSNRTNCHYPPLV